MPRRGSEPDEVHHVSGAPRSRSDDQQMRIKRYLISMAIRTVCVVLAVVVDGPLRWVFVAGAVGLPYIAVVMANAAGAPRDPGPAPMTAPLPPTVDLTLPPGQRSAIVRTDDP